MIFFPGTKAAAPVPSHGYPGVLQPWRCLHDPELFGATSRPFWSRGGCLGQTWEGDTGIWRWWHQRKNTQTPPGPFVCRGKKKQKQKQINKGKTGKKINFTRNGCFSLRFGGCRKGWEQPDGASLHPSTSVSTPTCPGTKCPGWKFSQ